MGKIRPLRRTAEVESQVRELVRHAEQFDRAPVLDSQIVEGVIISGATTTTVRHSLGRAYRGAVLMGTTSNGGVLELVVVHPDHAQAVGVPITDYVMVICATPPSDDERFALLVL